MDKKLLCPFCELDERIILENERARMFLSNPRKVEGHFLVTPKRHVEKPWELTPDEIKDIFELIFLVQKKLSETIAPGSDVMQHYRPYISQGKIKVNHIHFHVIPRDFNDIIYQRVEKHERSSHYEALSDDEKATFSQLFINE
jgi:diadenosine tetraphosphate (Ap4A) HIT family hydrolase